MSNKNNNILVSIITVCYNSEKHIRDTIESVLNQTYDNIEYIIVDGESTDNTLNIIKEYEPKFNGGMRWISEPDKGIYDAINKGISMSNGKIIGIINSDDWYNSNVVKKIIDYYDENIDIYYGDIYLVRNLYNKDYIKKKIPLNLNLLKDKMVLFHPSTFINKSLYDKLGKYDINYSIVSDYKFILESFLNNYNFKYINYPFAYFRTTGVSGSYKTIIEKYKVKNEIFGFKFRNLKCLILNTLKNIFYKSRNRIANIILSEETIKDLKAKDWIEKKN